MHKFLRYKHGFTLIELLVVIAIIGLLSSVVFASLNTARGKARDARRKADLAELQKGLELYYDTYGGYPSSACPAVDYQIETSLAMESKMLQFLPTFPKDPQDGSCYNNSYLYISNVYNNCSAPNAGATQYALYATLEDQTQNNLNPASGTDNWLRGGASACGSSNRPNYKVTTGGI
jgi:prepilin-type N-terminal cleavage/methylation domain-containing protein